MISYLKNLKLQVILDFQAFKSNKQQDTFHKSNYKYNFDRSTVFEPPCVP